MKMLTMLWVDDAGTVASEYLLVGTIVSLGLVMGLANLESALNAELSELANAFLALSQGYGINDQSACKGYKQGSQAIDTPDTVSFIIAPLTAVPLVSSNVNVVICP